MSTPTEEIDVDLAAADAKAAERAAKNGANGSASDSSAAATDIDVVNDDAQPAKVEKKAVSPEEGLEKLKQQLADEKAGRLAAEQRANEASRGEAAARGEVQTSQLDLVKGAIERLTESSDTLEGQYADAMAAQDFKAAAKLQRQMGDNSAKLIQLEAGKKALESAPKPTPRAPIDPVEHFVSQLSPASAAWVRAHPEFVRDNQKNEMMIAAHQFALKKGLKADTPEYFASVEKTLDIAAPIVAKVDLEPDAGADAAQAVGGRAAPAAAPVSRSNGYSPGNRSGVVKLTSQEVEMAGIMGMTVEEYARNKVALKKEGKLS
jgi:hypothetical protein